MTKNSQVPVISRTKPYIAPRNVIEELLVGIWAEILKTDGGMIGMDDGLFVPGGAHSLVVVELVARIAERFKVEILISDVFTHPSIRQLALMLEKSVCMDATSVTSKSK